jgi:hypothetical protein
MPLTKSINKMITEGSNDKAKYSSIQMKQVIELKQDFAGIYLPDTCMLVLMVGER